MRRLALSKSSTGERLAVMAFRRQDAKPVENVGELAYVSTS